MHHVPIRSFLAALCVAFPTSVLAQEAPGDEPPVLLEAETIALDAKAYASDFGVSFDEAVRRLLLMQASQDQIDGLRRDLGRDLTGVYFDHENGFDIKVRTRGPKSRPARELRRNGRQEADRRDRAAQQGRRARTPEAAAARRTAARRGLERARLVSGRDLDIVDAAMAANQSVALRFQDGSPKSLEEINATIVAQLPAFLERYPDMQGIGYDPKPDAIVLYVETDDARADVQTFAERIFDYSVSVEVGDGTVSTDAVYGGTGVTNKPGGDACMTGFVVAVGATPGVLTAGHCDPRQTNPFGSSDLVLMPGRRMGGGTGTGGDMQVMSNGDSFSPTFFAGDGFTVRAVTGYRSRDSLSEGVTSGSYLCKYSAQSGRRSCGRVKARYFAPGVEYQKENPDSRCSSASGASGTSCTLDYVQVVPAATVSGDYRLEAQGGDSGGPWFANNTAFGIHGGSFRRTLSGPVEWAYFTPIDAAFRSPINATLTRY